MIRITHEENGTIAYYATWAWTNYAYVTVIGHIPDDLDTLAEDDYTDIVKLKSLGIDIDVQVDSDGTARMNHYLVLIKYLGTSNITSQAQASQDLETIISNAVSVSHRYKILKTVGPSPSYMSTLSGTSDIVGYRLRTMYNPPKKAPITTGLSNDEPEVRVGLALVSIRNTNTGQTDGVVAWRKTYKFTLTERSDKKLGL